MMNDKKFLKEFADSFSSFVRQLSQESDRGTVIVAAALIDDSLQVMLQKRLCPSLERDDELFESAYAPLNSFASKIDLSYRVGIITFETRKSLHILRKLRNDFAHSSQDIDFLNNSVRDRLHILFQINENLISAMWDDLKKEILRAKDIPPSVVDKVKNCDDFLSLEKPRKVFEYLSASIAAALLHCTKNIEPIRSLDASR